MKAGTIFGGLAIAALASFIAHRIGYTRGYLDASNQYKALGPLSQNTVQSPGAGTMAGLPRFWRT